MQESSGVCFLVCLLMMLFDTVLYGAIGLYLDKVYFLNYFLLCPFKFYWSRGRHSCSYLLLFL